MADLSPLDAAQNIKIVGHDQTGVETVPVDAEVDEDGKGRLLVQASLNSSEIVPTMTPAFTIKYNNSKIPIDNVSYTVFYSRNGTGLFFGFQAAFNSDSIICRLRIDGNPAVEVPIGAMRQFALSAGGNSNRMQAGNFITTDGNLLDFSPRHPIPYKSSIEFSAISTAGKKDNTDWIVFVTED